MPHLGRPQLFTQGNVTLALSVADCIKQSLVDRVNYRPQGDAPLSPEELIQIRKYLLAENTLDGWQEYTHILFDVRLFLRDEEAAGFGIGECTFITELTTVDSDGVPTMLAVRVMGKSDKKHVTLCIWRDDDIPELCLLRHVLAYIYLADIKEGCLLFPNLSRRDTP
jgi:hypothetical protein